MNGKSSNFFARKFQEIKLTFIRAIEEPRTWYKLIGVCFALPALLICIFMGSVAEAASKVGVGLEWVGIATFGMFLSSVATAISGLGFSSARAKSKWLIATFLALIAVILSIVTMTGMFQHFGQEGVRSISAQYLYVFLLILNCVLFIGSSIAGFFIIDKNYVKERD